MEVINFQFVSSRAKTILELDPVLENFWERLSNLVIPEQKIAFIMSFQNAIASSVEWNYKGLLDKPSGERIIFSAKASPIKEGNETSYCGILQDITTENHSSSFLQLIINNIPGFVFWKDRNSVYQGCNNAFAQAAGVGACENIVGKTDFQLAWKKEESEFYIAVDRKVMESNQAQYHIIEPQLQDGGKETWLETCKIPLNDEQGKVIGILGTYVDITDRKKIADEMQKSQKLESLGILAGGIAHDFNNLLSGILGYVDLARSITQEELAKEYLGQALGAMDRAKALTLQLLTFAKGGNPIQKVTQLTEFIPEAARFALSGSNVSVEFDLAQNLWHCNIDKNQIGQVIDNLVINARQAMPKGGTIFIKGENISIADKSHALLAKGNYVKISVVDTGTGIPRKVLPMIFDPFYTTKTLGHGLGLATCFSIIKRHKGLIEVESEEGKGSRFHFYLPASDALEEEVSIRDIKVNRSGTIVVMDDEEVVRTSLGKMLESMGYEVACLKNGRECLEYFHHAREANHPLEAMIFDLTIPGQMAGRETAQEIRKWNQQIPIFLTSGYTENAEMTNPPEFGFTDSISKPFTKQELAAMLAKHFDR